MSEPLITIAVPTYSRLTLLKEAVASALAQTYSSYEILISLNPGGAEETAIEQWAAEQVHHEPRIRFQKNPVNLGMAGNWNACADAARGEYILLLADDDRIRANTLAVFAAAGSRDVDVVFSNHYLIDDTGELNELQTENTTRHYKRDLIPAGPVEHAGRWVWQGSVSIISSMIRTATVRRLRYREELNTPEIEMFARIAAEGGRFVFCEEYLGEYRTHGGSATAAGLRLDRLLPALSAINVDAATAPYKAAQIRELARSVLAQHLRKRELLKAQALLRTPEGRAASSAETLNGARGLALKALYWALRVSPKGLISAVSN